MVGNTGTNFANVSATNVILPQGTYPLRIVVDNGVLKLDTIQFSLFQLLPVSLISMNIKLDNNDTHIAWKVSEVNDCGNYEIYRSFDGINFTNISTVNCAGYNGEMNYEYFDRNITLAAGNSKTVYYRLNSKNHAGLEKILGYGAIQLTYRGGNEISIYPNPAMNGITSLSFKFTYPSLANIQVLNAAGQQVMLKTISANAGGNIVPLNLQSLPKGVYMVNLLSVDGKNLYETQKIIIN